MSDIKQAIASARHELGRRVRARRAERERLVHASHEVRNALSAIGLCLVDCERETSGVGLGKAHARALKGQLERINWAIDDIDRLASPGSNAKRPVVAPLRQPIAVNCLIERRVAAWERVAAASGVSLRVDRIAVGTYVNVDPRRLCQAMDNLVSNALRHGGGRIVISSRITGRRVQLAISDGGQGVQIPIERPRTVDLSQRHGHGLTIVRRAIAKAGGSIRATPSGVVVELPLAPSPRAGLSLAA